MKTSEFLMGQIERLILDNQALKDKLAKTSNEQQGEIDSLRSTLYCVRSDLEYERQQRNYFSDRLDIVTEELRALKREKYNPPLCADGSIDISTTADMLVKDDVLKKNLDGAYSPFGHEKKISRIKELREIVGPGFGLKEAKDAIEAATLRKWNRDNA